MTSSDENSGPNESTSQQPKADRQCNPSDLSNADTVHLLTNNLDQKFTAFKREIADETLHSSEQISKKLKTEQQLTFKFVGNQKQYQFNTETIDIVDQAQSHLNNSTTLEAYSCLKKLKEKIKHRNKLIRLAGKCEAGSDTALECEQDELASGFDDEKRMRQAEFRAPRRKKQKQNERKKRLSSNTTNPNTGNMGFGFAAQPSTSQAKMSFRAPLVQLLQDFTRKI